MRNLLIFAFFILAMVMVQFAQAQSVDDVIAKHLTALGGKEKLLALNSMKMEGNLSVQGFDVSLTITRLNNIGSRSDFEVAGTSNYQIVTPTKGTSFIPVRGMTEPADMPEAEFKVGQTQLDIQSALLNYKEKGSTVELLGTEKLDGDDVYKLKMTFKNGIVTNYFISSKTSMIIKTGGKRSINGEEMDVETTFSNYKQNAAGYWFAYTSSGLQGETNFDKIETNIKVDESIFK